MYFKLRCSSSAALARRPWVEAAEFQVLARCNLMHYIAPTLHFPQKYTAEYKYTGLQIHRSTNTNT